MTQMNRLLLSLILSLSLFQSAALAANPIWAVFSGNCESCLDSVYSECPSNYRTLTYAQCMCGGQGAKDFVSCSSVCQTYDTSIAKNQQRLAITSWYMYCIMFFKGACDEAQALVSPDIWEASCGAAALARYVWLQLRVVFFLLTALVRRLE